MTIPEEETWYCQLCNDELTDDNNHDDLAWSGICKNCVEQSKDDRNKEM